MKKLLILEKNWWNIFFNFFRSCDTADYSKFVLCVISFLIYVFLFLHSLVRYTYYVYRVNMYKNYMYLDIPNTRIQSANDRIDNIANSWKGK